MVAEAMSEAGGVGGGVGGDAKHDRLMRESLVAKLKLHLQGQKQQNLQSVLLVDKIVFCFGVMIAVCGADAEPARAR